MIGVDGSAPGAEIGGAGRAPPFLRGPGPARDPARGVPMAVRLHSRGGAGEVTGSRHYLEVGDATLQIDCGAFQGRRLANSAW